jgi:hypothetical protein
LAQMEPEALTWEGGSNGHDVAQTETSRPGVLSGFKREGSRPVAARGGFVSGQSGLVMSKSDLT